MERDDLERFINEQRDAFDTDRPSLKVWAQIEKSLDRTPRKRFRSIWIRSVAAAILVLVGVSIGMMVYPSIQEYRHLQVLNNSEEINGLETYFQQELDARFVELSDGWQSADQQEEYHTLEQNIMELKKELIKAPKHSREMIMQAIIASYEAKIALLEKAIEGENADKTNFYERQADI